MLKILCVGDGMLVEEKKRKLRIVEGRKTS
jgi:hypothetical protein